MMHTFTSSYRWRIALAPDAAEVQARGWFGLRAAGPLLRVPCQVQPDQPRWQPALQALDQALEQAGATAGAVTAVLSNHFVRYVVLPWQAEVDGPRELEALARWRLRAVYGELAAGWTVRCSAGGHGQPSVACAVDGELLDALQQLLRTRGLRLASVQPLLMAAFNDSRRALAGEAAFAVLESGRLCLGLLSDGALAAIVSRRIGADPAEVALRELAALEPALTHTELALLRVGEAAAWPQDAAIAARELAAAPRAMAECGAA